MNDDINFEYVNGADVDVGCGAMLMGEYWYFGGEKSGTSRQVSSDKETYLLNIPRGCTSNQF